VQDLKKYYGATKAVDGISFTVEQGEIFGMLGPNGAGKTTTTETVEGLRVADSGEVRVLGLDVKREPQKVKSRIGVQLQTTALYPRLTVREVLDLFSTFFPGEKRSTDTLIEMVNLREKEKTLSKDLSGGQRQRLSVALALINKPDIVFLDEPTTGLDPQARRSMWETVTAMPLTYLADALRQIMVGATPVYSLWVDLGVLAAWLVASAALAVRFFRWE
jgi:ABC-2 type transport system ATP-binding protein